MRPSDRWRGTVGVALLLAATACGKKDGAGILDGLGDEPAPSAGPATSPGGGGTQERPRPPAPPVTALPTVEWKDGKLTLKEIGAKGTVHVPDFEYSVRLEKLPRGTKVKLGEREEDAGDRGDFAAKLDLAARIGELTPKDAFDFRYKLDPQASLRLTFPGGGALDVSLPPHSVSYGASKALEALKDGRPVLFGPGDVGASAPAAHSLIWVEHGKAEIFGPAQKLRDVDWVALADKLPGRPGKSCSGYKATGEKGPGRTIQVKLVDEEVSIYERRTAKLVDKKTFGAREDCPMFASGDDASTYPDREAIKRWLRERREKG
ncbi:MAG: hypothetical protein HY908_37375 [Myxococcales bacterium]|nr:hypothetical protein [Myxococcales bacterium]